LPNLHIDNRLTQTGGRCRGYQRGIAFIVKDPARADHVIFEGRFPRACRHYVLTRTVLTPATFAYGVFKSLWEELGGTISGGVRSGTAPEGVKPLLTWQSHPLGQIIWKVNKFSNNVMCRELLLTLAAKEEGPPGTVAKGIEVLHHYLHRLGLDYTSLHLVNGAGLSRKARVSPHLLAGLLLHARRFPYMPEFISSLPIIGMDGTVKTRLTDRRVTGHAHIKTGTMDDVAAIAGYVYSQSGKEYVIVAIVNHPDAHRGPGQEVGNALIKWTFRQ
jgi:D-alanyl-D-alanine carboxypeptidase/D-alanyl-D-alanine-endopeptidase (penicillin-binding protein 4)